MAFLIPAVVEEIEVVADFAVAAGEGGEEAERAAGIADDVATVLETDVGQDYQVIDEGELWSPVAQFQSEASHEAPEYEPRNACYQPHIHNKGTGHT